MGIELKVHLSIGFSGASHDDVLEIDECEWADCKTQEQRDNLIEEHLAEWANNYIETSATLVQ